MGFKGVGDPPGSAHVVSSALVLLWAGITPAQTQDAVSLCSPKEFAGCLLMKAVGK